MQKVGSLVASIFQRKQVPTEQPAEDPNKTYYEFESSIRTDRMEKALGLVHKLAEDETATGLWYAAFYGRDSLIPPLLEKLKEFGTIEDFLANNIMVNQSISVAAEKGMLGAIKLLMGVGASLETLNSDRMAPIHCAAAHNHAETVKFCLDQGVRRDAKDRHGNLALHLAAKQMSKATVRTICAVTPKDELNTLNNSGYTPLDVAFKNCSLGVAEYLMDTGCQVNNNRKIMDRDRTGRTSLHLAVAAGKVKIVRYLCDKKVPLNAKDANGNTALHTAARHNHEEIVGILIDADIDVEPRNEQGNTALMIAKQRTFQGCADIIARATNRKLVSVYGVCNCEDITIGVGGAPGAGKTTFIDSFRRSYLRSIFSNESQTDHEDRQLTSRTRGIRIERLKDPLGTSNVYHFLDFGGHQEYIPSHSLFISESTTPAMAICMVNANKSCETLIDEMELWCGVFISCHRLKEAPPEKTDEEEEDERKEQDQRQEDGYDSDDDIGPRLDIPCANPDIIAAQEAAAAAAKEAEAAAEAAAAAAAAAAEERERAAKEAQQKAIAQAKILEENERQKMEKEAEKDGDLGYDDDDDYDDEEDEEEEDKEEEQQETAANGENAEGEKADEKKSKPEEKVLLKMPFLLVATRHDTEEQKAQQSEVVHRAYGRIVAKFRHRLAFEAEPIFIDARKSHKGGVMREARQHVQRLSMHLLRHTDKTPRLVHAVRKVLPDVRRKIGKPFTNRETFKECVLDVLESQKAGLNIRKGVYRLIDAVLQLLSCCGEVVVFSSSEELEDLVVLKADWLLTTIIGHLCSPKNFPRVMVKFDEDGARADKKATEKVLSKCEGSGDVILKMLASIGICIIDGQEVILPSRLPERQPAKDQTQIGLWKQNPRLFTYSGVLYKCDEGVPLSPGVPPLIQIQCFNNFKLRHGTTSYLWRRGIRVQPYGSEVQGTVVVEPSRLGVYIACRGPAGSQRDQYALTQILSKMVFAVIDRVSPGSNVHKLILSPNELQRLVNERSSDYPCIFYKPDKVVSLMEAGSEVIMNEENAARLGITDCVIDLLHHLPEDHVHLMSTSGRKELVQILTQPTQRYPNYKTWHFLAERLGFSILNIEHKATLPNPVEVVLDEWARRGYNQTVSELRRICSCEINYEAARVLEDEERKPFYGETNVFTAQRYYDTHSKARQQQLANVRKMSEPTQFADPKTASHACGTSSQPPAATVVAAAKAEPSRAVEGNSSLTPFTPSWEKNKRTVQFGVEPKVDVIAYDLQLSNDTSPTGDSSEGVRSKSRASSGLAGDDNCGLDAEGEDEDDEAGDKATADNDEVNGMTASNGHNLEEHQPEPDPSAREETSAPDLIQFDCDSDTAGAEIKNGATTDAVMEEGDDQLMTGVARSIRSAVEESDTEAKLQSQPCLERPQNAEQDVIDKIPE